MSLLRFSQTLQCLACHLVFTKPDNLWQHQAQTGHGDFELHHVYTYRQPQARMLALTPGSMPLPPIGCS